jgi:2-keto-4-pentenoate hydratase/2-oxohepta-3-ene-1,7-dioic acid hydratase in catechol pathway
VKLRVTARGLIGEDAERGRWVRLPGSEDLLDRWIQPGQTVELAIDGIGTLTNRISPTAVPV